MVFILKRKQEQLGVMLYSWPLFSVHRMSNPSTTCKSENIRFRMKDAIITILSKPTRGVQVHTYTSWLYMQTVLSVLGEEHILCKKNFWEIKLPSNPVKWQRLWKECWDTVSSHEHLGVDVSAWASASLGSPFPLVSAAPFPGCSALPLRTGWNHFPFASILSSRLELRKISAVSHWEELDS